MKAGLENKREYSDKKLKSKACFRLLLYLRGSRNDDAQTVGMMSNLIRQKPSLFRAALVCVIALAWLAGCALFGGGGEGSWARSQAYTVTPPAGWRKREPVDSDKAFQLSSGSIATVTSSCHRHPDASLPLLTKHLLFGTREVNIEKRENLTIDGTEGLLSKLTASMDGSKFHMILVVARKEGCVFDFSLVSPKPLQAGDESEFLSFVRSYRNGKH